MAFQGKRIVSVTPAGRRKYLEILVPYLLDNRGIIDEHRFWVNTNVPEDIAYLESLTADYPDFFTLEYLDNPRPDLVGVSRITEIRHFFHKCCDPDTVYVRFDDDICWIHPDAIERLVTYRLANPEPFLVYPAIINNGRTAYIHQVMGYLPEQLAANWGYPPRHGGPKFLLTHETPMAAATIHHAFLGHVAAGTVEDLYFPNYNLHNFERVSINCICWTGEDFSRFDGIVGDVETRWEEEVWLTEVKPKKEGRPSVIVGNALVAHFAFFTQRPQLEKNTNLLEIYRILSEQRHTGDTSFLI